jgi:hypothetical protein
MRDPRSGTREAGRASGSPVSHPTQCSLPGASENESNAPLAVILLVAGCTTQPTHAGGGDQDVQELYRECTNTDLQSLCVGYIAGAMDIMAVNGSSGITGQYALCHPGGGVSHGAGIQAFKNWAAKHPERLGDPEYSGAAAAISEVWPCDAK